ncbi:MAG TPA: hypothetical protein PLY87_03925, partial [Planctomycetaceae bacterium]|nr:hypothetical protein [Planctomycetaceae bacterium]
PKTEEPKTEEPKTEEPKTEEPSTSGDECSPVADEKDAAEEKKADEPASVSDTPDTIAERLKTAVVIEFKNTPLNEAMTYIGTAIKTEITIDGEALKAAGFTQVMPQTYDLGSVPALSAIDAILQKYAAERDPIVLVVDETNKKLLITTGIKAKADGLTPYEMKAPVAATTDETNPDKPEFVIPVVEYKPLDDELKAGIREQLLDQKVRAALTERQDLIIPRMKELEAERAKYRRDLFSENSSITQQQLNEKTRETAPAAIEKLKAIAKEFGCDFVETPLLSFSELAEGETYPIGSATVPESQTVARFVFESFPEDVTNETTLFIAQRATRNSDDPDGGETRYCWVVTGYAPSHVPALDDPGIHDQVVQAWKRVKAREIAKARAQELADVVKAGLAKPEGEKKTMSESLEGQTVLGTDTSAVVTMRQTLPFSWMEQVNAPPMTFQPPSARLSSIRFADEIGGTIRFAGPKFMAGVFEDLANNEVGVVHNEDFSSYYVVQVLDRTQDDQIGEDILRQQFLTEGKQFGFSRGAVAGLVQNDIAGPTALEWEKETWRKYGINPDERRDD